MTNGKPASNSCLIYIYGEIGADVAKFGKTRQPANLRRQQHEKNRYEIIPLKFLVGVMGSDADERVIIDYWKHIAKPNSREWVDATDIRFRNWLRFLCQQGYAALTEEEAQEVPLVDSKLWLPTNPRALQEAVQGRFDFRNDRWADLVMDEEIMEGDYYTAPEITAAARTAMGMIDLDPASCRSANKHVQATRFYTVYKDGLLQHWNGRVWANPPFSQWDMWAPKAIEEFDSGRATEMCIMMTTLAATQLSVVKLKRRSNAICIPDGRICCWGPKASSPREGHIILYFGKKIEQFCKAFGELGMTWATLT